MTTSEAKEKHGKTFADFLDGLLNKPKSLLLFSVLVFWAALVILSLFFLLLWLTKSSGASELQISALGSVHFESTVNGKKQILIVVRPQGWQQTFIPVRAGQRLTFEAAGRVSIDLQGLVDAAKEMNELENTERDKHQKEIIESKQNAPEDFFDEDQATRDKYNDLKSRFTYLWAEPEGLKDANGMFVIEDKDYAGRTKNKAIPNAPYGALIGAIISSPNPPLDKKDFFLIGKSESMFAKATGDLWLNINDVIDKGDPVESKIYYFDNIGFFWVKVTIEG
ncbi:MAG TPA: hypothetical protein VKB86_18555 [Pyrinomonadaceae bacterium]|nr:hypothetical protein [Pyrinomonadaceae bacterium]